MDQGSNESWLGDKEEKTEMEITFSHESLRNDENKKTVAQSIPENEMTTNGQAAQLEEAEPYSVIVDEKKLLTRHSDPFHSRGYTMEDEGFMDRLRATMRVEQVAEALVSSNQDTLPTDNTKRVNNNTTNLNDLFSAPFAAPRVENVPIKKEVAASASESSQSPRTDGNQSGPLSLALSVALSMASRSRVEQQEQPVHGSNEEKILTPDQGKITKQSSFSPTSSQHPTYQPKPSFFPSRSPLGNQRKVSWGEKLVMSHAINSDSKQEKNHNQQLNGIIFQNPEKKMTPQPGFPTDFDQPHLLDVTKHTKNKKDSPPPKNFDQQNSIEITFRGDSASNEVSGVEVRNADLEATASREIDLTPDYNYQINKHVSAGTTLSANTLNGSFSLGNVVNNSSVPTTKPGKGLIKKYPSSDYPAVRHRRTVSWGVVHNSNNDLKGKQQEGQHHQTQPPADGMGGSDVRDPLTDLQKEAWLHGNIINNTPPLVVDGVNRPNPNRRTKSTGTEAWRNQEEQLEKSKRRRRFQLDEVISAGFEDEAETHILRAIEIDQRHRLNQRSQHARMDTMTSTILSAADQASHDFDMDSVAGSYFFDEKYGSTPPASESEAAVVRVRSGSIDGRGSDSGHYGNEPNEPSLTSKSLTINSSLRDPSQQESTKSNLSHDSPRANSILPKARLDCAKSKGKPRSHRRTLSVEQTLNGLTAAMHQIHEEQQRPEHISPESLDNDVDLEMQPLNGISGRESQGRMGPADRFADDGVFIMEQQDGSRKRKERKATMTAEELAHVAVDEELHENSGIATEDEAKVAGSNNGKPRPSLNPASSRPNMKNFRRSSTIRPSVLIAKANDVLQDDWQMWQNFFRLRSQSWVKYAKHVVFYLIIPATLIAAILYYLSGNPPTGRGTSVDSTIASTSWWIIFACVRQVITFSLSVIFQTFFIDFLALDTRILLHLFGPIITLLIVQSKGWPFIAFTWGAIDFAMLHGGGRFAAHWLFWQNGIGLFNEDNPAGTVIRSRWNTKALETIMVFAACTTIKRFVLGLWLGRRAFKNHGQHLAKVLNNMLLLSELAAMARRIERSVGSDDFVHSNHDGLRGMALSLNDDDLSSKHTIGFDRMVDNDGKESLGDNINPSDRAKIQQLLDEWEEPQINRPEDEEVSISAVLKFRRALTFIQQQYPFSYAFGPASSRAECIESAQDVYERLMMRTPDKDILHFETLALLALDEECDELDEEKSRELIKLFRPDRQGNLTLLDFVKSVDSVYKSYRLLSASIANSSRIDRSFERIINFFYYFLWFFLLLFIFEMDPAAIFLSFSSVLLSVSFMIGRASSNYFEGLLFILVRKPYDIGDRIHISNVERDPSIDGSLGWVVENVTLIETTAIWTPTRERCSLSNGSLANSRIINQARSPMAQFVISMKFPINTPYRKILIFKSAVEEYLKARPREWIALNGFRATNVVPDRGFVEYIIVPQHREKWQEFGQVMDSRANFCSYCNEVATQLKMNYTAPPLPVDLRQQPVTTEDIVPDDETTKLGEEFRAMALTKHNIFC